jgi:uncharacterized protein (TIGR00369 family)
MDVKMGGPALEAFLAEVFPQVAESYRVERVAPMAVDIRLIVGERHLRPGGTVSGPAMFELADLAMYAVVLAMIGPVALAVTTNAAIDFLRKPAAGRDLTGRARLLKLGRTLAVGDVMVFSDGVAEPVARAGMTYAIPPGVRGAAG